MPSLEHLDFNPFTVSQRGPSLTFPPGLPTALPRLRYLDVAYRGIEAVPDLSALAHLTTLRLRGNELTACPALPAGHRPFLPNHLLNRVRPVVLLRHIYLYMSIGTLATPYS